MAEQGAPVGLTAFFDISKFQNNVRAYIGDLKALNQETNHVAKASEQAGQAMGQSLTLGAAAAGAAAAGVMIIITKLIDKLSEAVTKLKEFGLASLHMASRVKELTIAAVLLGQRMGHSSEYVLAQIDAMKEYQIRADVAARAVAQFSRYNLDLAKSTELARTAQNAAIFTAKDSSEVLEQVIWGIVTLNKRILRTQGINVNLQKAFVETARAENKTVLQLGVHEKVQIALNEVLKEGVRIQGLYEAALETPGKQLRSLQREVVDLQAALGAPFLDAWNILITILRKFVSGMTDAMTEGGRLYDIMVFLGAIAKIVAWEIKKLSDDAITALKSLFESFRAVFEDIADKSYDWGGNIIVQVARGIIQAAQTVLIYAIQFVGKVIAWFLAAFSPPRLLPDLPLWGAAAMTSYLKGFTKADFSVLKELQSPLKSALQVLADAGRFAVEKVGTIWADISELLIKGLAKGAAGEDIFRAIRRAAGEFASELIALVKLEFKLADATDEVANAEKRLAAARRQEADADKRVRSLIRGYNDLLRAGSSKQILKTRLKEINAAERDRIASQRSVSAKEEALLVAREQLALIKEQVELQKQLVDQLIELAKARVDSAKAAAKEAALGGVGGAGAGEDLFDEEALGAAFDPEAIRSKLDEAIDAMAVKIRLALQKLKKRVKEEVKDLAQPIVDEFEKIEPKLKEVWERIKQGISDEDIFAAILEILKIQFNKAFGPDAEWRTRPPEGPVAGVVRGFGEFFGGGEKPETPTPLIDTTWTDKANAAIAAFNIAPTLESKLIAAGDVINAFTYGTSDKIALWADETVTKFGEWGLQAGTDISEWATQAGIDIDTWYKGTGDSIDSWSVQAKADIAAWRAQAGEDISAWATETAGNISSWAAGTVANIASWSAGVIASISGLFTGLARKFEYGFKRISIKARVAFILLKRRFEQFKTDATTLIKETISNIIQKFVDQKNSLIQSGRDFLQGFINGILEKVQSLIDTVTEAVKDAIAAAVEAIGATSPSTVMRKIGQMAMKGFELGIGDAAEASANAMRNAMASAIAPASVTPAAVSTITNNVRVPMNVNINNNMDAAELRYLIRQVIAEEIHV